MKINCHLNPEGFCQCEVYSCLWTFLVGYPEFLGCWNWATWNENNMKFHVMSCHFLSYLAFRKLGPLSLTVFAIQAQVCLCHILLYGSLLCRIRSLLSSAGEHQQRLACTAMQQVPRAQVMKTWAKGKCVCYKGMWDEVLLRCSAFHSVRDAWKACSSQHPHHQSHADLSLPPQSSCFHPFPLPWRWSDSIRPDVLPLQFPRPIWAGSCWGRPRLEILSRMGRLARSSSGPFVDFGAADGGPGSPPQWSTVLSLLTGESAPRAVLRVFCVRMDFSRGLLTGSGLRIQQARLWCITNAALLYHLHYPPVNASEQAAAYGSHASGAWCD